ncbi:MAG: tRNA adenosine(34) deaminase TadA [Clostridia bacterium]|nr:tRNA adenosine(34) deaminase TadA [Clostridia bacterium]
MKETGEYKDEYMTLAIGLAQASAEADEVPVGVVVVKDDKVVATSENMKERLNDATKHAEMVALSRATEAVGNWWLENCDVYVTLEPCPMCAGAMINSRIRALYFGAYDEKTGAAGSKVNLLESGLFNHDIVVSGGHRQEECSKLLSSFFKNKRK